MQSRQGGETSIATVEPVMQMNKKQSEWPSLVAWLSASGFVCSLFLYCSRLTIADIPYHVLFSNRHPHLSVQRCIETKMATVEPGCKEHGEQVSDKCLSTGFHMVSTEHTNKISSTFGHLAQTYQIRIRSSKFLHSDSRFPIRMNTWFFSQECPCCKRWATMKDVLCLLAM